MKLDLPRAHGVDAGVWFSTPGSTWYPTHWHEELEVNLVLWGTATYEIGGREVSVGPGSLLLLAPGERHTLLAVTHDLAMWVASFRPEAVRDAERLSGVPFLGRRTWSVRQLESDRVLALSALHARLLPCDDPRRSKLSARRLLAHTLRAWRGDDGARSALSGEEASTLRPPHPAVTRAQGLLREERLLREGEGAPSLSVLSRRCGLAGDRLSRLFKQQMGLSIVQFRNHFRVQRFIGRFGHGKRVTMLDAALDCGFGSYAQFHRAFHQVTGYAPSEHLRRVRAGIVVPMAQGTPHCDE